MASGVSCAKLRFLRHCLLKNRDFVNVKSQKNVRSVTYKTSDRVEKDDFVTINPDLTSLASKGFLRSLKGYDPPSDASKRVVDICLEYLGGIKKDAAISLEHYDLTHDRLVRFKILAKCVGHFNHDIPNSQLHKINTIGDLITYFTMPLKAATSYQDLSTASDLPPNLHIQHDYVRFHPETDTMFGGISAFPKSSCVVSSLKGKKKYKGFKAPKAWPFDYVP